MSLIKTIKTYPGASLAAIIDAATQNLSMQYYDVKSQIMGPCAAEIIVSKDRTGLKNAFLGLGVECRVAITVENDTLTLIISNEWSNKIVAFLISWIFCWVPFVTGIMGTINQYNLPEKITTAFTLACNSCFTPRSAEEATPVDFVSIDNEE
jgi:hypothetical protein